MAKNRVIDFLLSPEEKNGRIELGGGKRLKQTVGEGKKLNNLLA